MEDIIFVNTELAEDLIYIEPDYADFESVEEVEELFLENANDFVSKDWFRGLFGNNVVAIEYNQERYEEIIENVLRILAVTGIDAELRVGTTLFTIEEGLIEEHIPSI